MASGMTHRPVLVAEMDDIRPFIRLLRGVALKPNALMEILGDMGQISVTVEDSRTLTAIAWIPTCIFTSFTFNPPVNDPPIFEIELESMLHCLYVLGNTGPIGKGKTLNKRRFADDNDEAGDDEGRWGRDRKGATSMRMEWMGKGHELKMLLRSKGKGPITEFSLRTLEPEELVNPEFDINQLVFSVQMRSEDLLSALADLPPSSRRITLVAIPPKDSRLTSDQVDEGLQKRQRDELGQLTIQAEGDFGSVELDYPNEKDVLERFACEESISVSYHSAHFNHLSRALHGTVKVCIQIDVRGLLCAQIMTQEPIDMNTHRGLLEFKMPPLEEDVID
ncbi:hypothetical protein L204_101809 [Cryptococcus depauperatus]|nr:hypothetical protein L204_04219 [Cryptococcus depauperatus CBS 7855]